MHSTADPHVLARWRLILGKSAEEHAITCEGDAQCQRIEQLVGFLFGESGASGQTSKRGGKESSRLTVPEWVDLVGELFPHQAKEVLERELVQRRGIAELLEQPKMLEKVEPNVELVKTQLTPQGPAQSEDAHPGPQDHR